MAADDPARGGEAGTPGENRDVPSVRSLERKILAAGGLILVGIALSGRFGMLPGAAVGAALAWGNFFLVRRILEKAFSGSGPVRKGFIVQYALKFLALAGAVYLVVRSGRFDIPGFLLGLSALFLGVVIEAAFRSFR